MWPAKWALQFFRWLTSINVLESLNRQHESSWCTLEHICIFKSSLTLHSRQRTSHALAEWIGAYQDLKAQYNICIWSGWPFCPTCIKKQLTWFIRKKAGDGPQLRPGHAGRFSLGSLGLQVPLAVLRSMPIRTPQASSCRKHNELYICIVISGCEVQSHEQENIVANCSILKTSQDSKNV